jgi:hypothetical protein
VASSSCCKMLGMRQGHPIACRTDMFPCRAPLVFDLGEFLQKGAARNKYGTREELVVAISAVQDHRMHAYADVVFNHKDGGDYTEEHAKRIHRREGKGDSHRLS